MFLMVLNMTMSELANVKSTQLVVVVLVVCCTVEPDVNTPLPSEDDDNDHSGFDHCCISYFCIAF